MAHTTPIPETMTNDIQILIDSDAFVGWLLEGDDHYERSGKIFAQLQQRQMAAATTSAVIAETATVLSHRQGQKLARTFLEIIEEGDLPVIYITESFYHDGLAIFKEQAQKRTSVTDCINVAVCQHLEIKSIFSFDKAYPKHFDLQLASDLLRHANGTEE